MTSNSAATQEPPTPSAHPGAFGGLETPFQRVKPTCTSLLKNSKITPSNTSQVIDLLSQLVSILRGLSDPKTDLTPKFVEFIYLPLSIILDRNAPPAPPLPDQILEKLFQATSLLCQQWWWAMDFAVWKQLLRLSAFLIGGPRTGPSASLVARSEETKEAAVLCLEALLRKRSSQEQPDWCSVTPNDRSEYIAREARHHSHFTVIGSTIGSLLDAANSEKVSLRALSLRVVGYLLSDFVPSNRLPTFLPGVVAKSCGVAIARNTARGWQASDVITEALSVLNVVIVGSIGDEVCENEGILRKAPTSFDDIASMANHSGSEEPKPTSDGGDDPYVFHRTEAWLQGSASQIHNAINSLSPILSHPTPPAQLALVELSYVLLRHATHSLPTLHPLLLSHLLTLSVSSHTPLADAAKAHLETLLVSQTIAIPLLDVLAKLTQENLLALPPLILANSDSKVERVCNQIEAICILSHNPALSKSEIGVGHLLGPTGGIERWGLGLLGVVELTPLPRGHPTQSSSSAPVGLIMDDLDTPDHPFPKMRLRYVKAASTQLAVERMLRGLGAAGGVDALFSVEWFVGTATAGQGALEASALWCASRVYEGIVGVVLKEFSIPSESRGVRTGADGGINKMNVEERRRVEKTARQLVRTISEFWDTLEREEMASQTLDTSDSLALYGDSRLPTEHVKGLDPLITLLDVGNKRQLSISTGTEKSGAEGREMARLHAALALQTLSISSSALGSRFPPLLLHAIYPILRSLVSSNNFLSSTAMAALHHVTAASAYAAPANLLLSNFDYALDSASRRLFRSRLDLKATKVLVILIRLVGKDVVQRAGDVVEECFDRLDEFHGYSNIVEGLVEVLSEIVKVVEAEEGPMERPRPNAWGRAQATAPEAKSGTAAFTEWYNQRKVGKLTEEIPEDFGPAPQRPWGREPSVDEDPAPKDPPSDDTPKPSTTQTLISKIIRRCLPFLTHSSPLIRARMLSLMRSATIVLPVEEIGPSIHSAWPFILNRLKDSQTFVVAEAARLIDSLAWHFGEFMGSRMDRDVWPAYRKMLEALEAGDRESALTARKYGPETAYSHSHRLYVAMLSTLNSVFASPQERHWVRNDMTWDIAVTCRRFLSASANKELQATARTLYQNLGRKNNDLVWNENNRVFLRVVVEQPDEAEPEAGVITCVTMGIVGTSCSGKKTILKYLLSKGFTQAVVAAPVQSEESLGGQTLSFPSAADLLDFATRNWRSNYVTLSLQDRTTLEPFTKRPFFLLVSLDAPVMVRWSRQTARSGNIADTLDNLREFLTKNDREHYGTVSDAEQRTSSLHDILSSSAHISIINHFETIEGLHNHLEDINILDQERLRPSWDSYFMTLSELAAQRSNCMKRRVGAILVRKNRILATGYNGTPRGLTNCNEGGCARCNGLARSGEALDECLCLHAEENALLEAGRERVGDGAVLYCNTCPCLRCSVKIVQTGVKEVVYNFGYSMDAASARVFEEAGVKLRQHSPPKY